MCVLAVCVFSLIPQLPLLSPVTHSLACWPSSEGTFSWPDLLSDPSIVGSTLQRLARVRMGRLLGAEEDSLSLASPCSPAKYLSALGELGRGRGSSHAGPALTWPLPADEDLIRQVLADGASGLTSQDPEMETDLLTGL